MCRQAIELKFLHPELSSALPQYSTSGSAALDLYSANNKSIILEADQCNLIGTGIAIHIADPTLAGLIIPRSGLGHIKGLILGNGIGLIDSDYQGEIKVSCWNRSNSAIEITPLMRFAQLVVIPVVQAKFIAVNNFSNHSKRGSNGFGHTGVN